MSAPIEKSLENRLQQLKCHFTWNLKEKEETVDEFDNRLLNKVEFQNSERNATKYNIKAYVKHLRGENEAALKSLEDAECFIQQQHPDQVETRSLVTWGNYAWVYYHMGQLSKAQAYLDKVRGVCEKLSSPYRIESPELDCEEGWALLKCTKNQNERGKVCFEKALEKDPKNPEFTSGWAIASYRLDYWPAWQDSIGSLKQAIRLSPDHPYLKVLMALKLERMHENQGQKLVKEALRKSPCATDVLLSAAKFYYKTHDMDRAIKLLNKALVNRPYNAYVNYYIGCCYRSKVKKRDHRRETVLSKNQKTFLTHEAIKHLRKAEENKEMLKRSCSYLAGLYAMANRYEEADYYYQKEFKNVLSPGLKQLLHLQYGNFQLFQMKCEDKAIHHFMEGVKIRVETDTKEQMINKLHIIALNRLSENEFDSEALYILVFLRELNEEDQQAAKEAERVLDAEKAAPSASLHEDGDQ
uniref:interferon-induced protein with tetratricopeptide repeats 2-like n=1 Tax=Myodes glareolus TaxID=447135 RepID=UPI00202026B6|nr:interferon-induced protein with tetratricopeptide repeats 2-like [Myodes glareolus]